MSGGGEAGWGGCRGRLGNVWLQPGPSKADGDRGRALEVRRGQELEEVGSPNLEAGELSVSFVF